MQEMRETMTARAEDIRAEMTAEKAAQRDAMAQYDEEKAAWFKRWNSWAGLVNAGRKHSYGGTVPEKEIARRRKANKAARIARRAGR